MSEQLLKALMQLFAIGAGVERLSNQSRALVEAFLRQQLSLQQVPEYLAVFDDYIRQFQGSGDSVTQRKKISVSSVKTLRICTDINKELSTRHSRNLCRARKKK